jgi:hypothetical protein
LGLFGRHEQRGGAEDSAGVARLGGEEEGAEKEQCLVAGHKGAKERRGERRRSEGERHTAAVVGGGEHAGDKEEGGGEGGERREEGGERISADEGVRDGVLSSARRKETQRAG